jgi:hypothetical protein
MGGCKNDAAHVYTFDPSEDSGPGDALYCLRCGVEVWDENGSVAVRGRRRVTSADAHLLDAYLKAFAEFGRPR